MKLIQQAAKGSARVVDRFGLDAETASGRIDQLRARVRGAARAAADMDPLRVMFNGMAEGLETVVGALSQGDLEGSLAGLRDIGTAISTAWDNILPKIDAAMSRLIGAEQWEAVKSTVGGVLDGISQSVEDLGRIWDGLFPHVQNAWNLISPVLSAIAEVVRLTFENVKLVLDGIGDFLEGDFSGAWTAIQTVVSNTGMGIRAVIDGVAKFLQGILPGIAETATSIGTAIWDGIVGAIDGLAAKVGAIFNAAVNAIRDAWNSLDFRIPGFSLPAIDIGFPSTGNGDLDKLLPRIRGGPFRIFEGTGDLIPDLAQGGIVKARPGGMLARIGEAGRDEAVIPLGRGGGLGNNYTINVNTGVGDPVAIGKAIVETIRQYERRSGAAWRS
jgi:Flp pilus assembly pilin Flp